MVTKPGATSVGLVRVGYAVGAFRTSTLVVAGVEKTYVGVFVAVSGADSFALMGVAPASFAYADASELD